MTTITSDLEYHLGASPHQNGTNMMKHALHPTLAEFPSREVHEIANTGDSKRCSLIKSLELG